ncbi:MAG: 3'(2'),5'-bisphosphate nucleotidase [Actinomycetota bacterium]
MGYATERQIAIDAVVLASRLCRSVRETLISAETEAKKDKSPVTVADYGAQALVSAALAEAFPDDPLVGEEDAVSLRADDNAELRSKVIAAVTRVAPEFSEGRILDAIDRGSYAGGPRGRHWTLDPIDGTKGFLRNEQYAVALALIEDGEVVLGVLGCPNLPVDAARPEGPVGCLFVAVKGEGAVQRDLAGGDERPIHVTSVENPSKASFCESVESGHSSHGAAAEIADTLGVTEPPIRMDSQAKYAAVARGDASIYLRLPTRAGYEEKIWDHAAGAIVIQEAGGAVTDTTGKPLDFSLGRTLAGNVGVVATNALLHQGVVAAVRGVLGAK